MSTLFSAPTPTLLDPGLVLDGIEIRVQPIVDVATGTVHAAEALARFPHVTTMGTEEVFAAAHLSGFGYALEAACITAALRAREQLPAGVGLNVNVSPGVLCHPVVARSWPRDLDGVIVEVTEHDAGDTVDFRNRVLNMRRRGARIAVDDVSTGYAGLLRLATLYPDYVKIDRQVVTGVRDSLAQSAVLETLVAFSHRLGAAVIGEGVETFDDLVSLSEFDVDYAQGWAIGRPTPTLEPICDMVVETCQDGRRQVLRQAGPRQSASRTQAIFTVAAELASADVGDLGPVVGKVAEELGVDAIGVSLLGANHLLREIASTGTTVDGGSYAVDDYPATRDALETGAVIEVQLSDPDADSAERALMIEQGMASLLLVPVRVQGRPLGVLEFAHRTPRRWSTVEIAHARGLAENLSPVLQRLR